MPDLFFNIVDCEQNPLSSKKFRAQCKDTLNETGALVLEDFLNPSVINSIRTEGVENQDLAYFTKTNHNIYLLPTDPRFPSYHPRNREVSSSKGCITTDQIPEGSDLRILYADQEFRNFLCAVLDIEGLYEYADPLSSINVHYASEGQELGWHFDNSSFAITLMIQTPKEGGEFEYVKDVRNSDLNELNFALSEEVLNGKLLPKTLSMGVGSLVLFRGRNSMHRVTAVKGDRTRIVVVLAYNTEFGISLSESARMTFYGRIR